MMTKMEDKGRQMSKDMNRLMKNLINQTGRSSKLRKEKGISKEPNQIRDKGIVGSNLITAATPIRRGEVILITKSRGQERSITTTFPKSPITFQGWPGFSGYY